MIHEPARILLTGFGPFPGVPENATGPLVMALAERARRRWPAHVFEAGILDTEWTTAPARIAELLERFQPSLALHFGVAREAQGFRLERVARNLCREAPDAAGCLPATRHILHGGPDVHPVSIDVEHIARRLSHLGLPVALSEDAGAYLCNAVLYHALETAKGLSVPCRAGFIHIPTDLTSASLSFERALEGSLEILDACLDG
ncbi:MAG: pyroglutamyl-peptidase I [Hyphomicrobium sp.]